MQPPSFTDTLTTPSGLSPRSTLPTWKQSTPSSIVSPPHNRYFPELNRTRWNNPATSDDTSARTASPEPPNYQRPNCSHRKPIERNGYTKPPPALLSKQTCPNQIHRWATCYGWFEKTSPDQTTTSRHPTYPTAPAQPARHLRILS